MIRVTGLVVLLAVGSLSVGVAAHLLPGSRHQEATRVVIAEKLKDNLYLLKGGGGNTAVLIGASSVVVVDTKNPGWGQPLLDKIKELTPKPVTMIVSTHTHCDHVCGNVEFPVTVDVVTHENTKATWRIGRLRPGFQTRRGTSSGRTAVEGCRPERSRTDVDRQRQRADRSLLLRTRAHRRRRLGGLPAQR